MSDDIVERLRTVGPQNRVLAVMLDEAADEIEVLRMELESARARLANKPKPSVVGVQATNSRNVWVDGVKVSDE